MKKKKRKEKGKGKNFIGGEEKEKGGNGEEKKEEKEKERKKKRRGKMRKGKKDKENTQKGCVCCVRGSQPLILALQSFLGHLGRRNKPWEVWDCQLGNLTAGKVSGGGGSGLPMVVVVVYRLNHALQEQLNEEKKINEKWLTNSKKVSQCISEKITHQKKKVLGGELFTEASPKQKGNENLFILASMGYDQEMVPKSKDWVERLNPDSKLPNFNTGRILVPESQAVNESLKLTEGSNDPESVEAWPYHNAYPSKRILKAKAKPFPLCTYCGFNDHRSDDCRNYLECEICGSYDHFTSGHNRVIHIRGRVLAESSQSSESSIGVKCDTCGITVHSTIDHNEFDHFRRETHQGAHLVPRQWMLKDYEWCQELSEQICRATRKKSQAPEMIMSFIKMIENHNDVKVKQIRTDNGTEFRNHELERFYDEKGISQNFSSPYTPEQNVVAKRKNRTLIEAARIMLNGSVLSKYFWTEAVRITFYTQNRSIIFIRHDKTPYAIFKERIPDISYFHVFGCLVFIHNQKDHLGKFDAKADDGYFLGYSFVSKAFRIFNTKRQQIKETYNVTFDESMEAIRFTNTLVDKIGIDDSSRYPPDDLLHEDDTSRQYQVDSDVSYYISPHGRKLIELTQEKEVPKRTNVQNKQDEQSSFSKNPSETTLRFLNSINEPSVPEAASTNECLFANFLSEVEPKKVSEALKHTGKINVMQEELNQFYRNKVWTHVPLPYGKIAIGSKWVFRNKKDEHGTTNKNKARLVAQSYSQEEGIDYDETFTPVERMEAIGIFLAYATYMNLIVYQMDVKSAFLNGKPKEEVYVKQPLGFESSEFPDYVCKLDKALYGLKQAPKACSSVKTSMVPSNNLRPDLAGKPVNETLYRGMIGYQKGTPTLGLYYPKCLGFDLKGYSDLDYVGCNTNGKITSGSCKIHCGKLVCWSAKKQQSVAMSSVEAEYVVAAGCCASIL
ncbi:retrovirus-related pol polyprotein from transposon TNT 1-94 [Tanacetum coccineum]|uniref:Retrovirus-related pol polyprotein from transposon TNT 1-94 n=1 Tax=Tanacetum coccineum TaxID=301880 RepID=A0ABQ5H537_9ASTR